jgi:hypothetical protein
MALATTQQPTGYEREGHNGWSRIKVKSRVKREEKGKLGSVMVPTHFLVDCIWQALRQ